MAQNSAYYPAAATTTTVFTGVPSVSAAEYIPTAGTTTPCSRVAHW